MTAKLFSVTAAVGQKVTGCVSVCMRSAPSPSMPVASESSERSQQQRETSVTQRMSSLRGLSSRASTPLTVMLAAQRLASVTPGASSSTLSGTVAESAQASRPSSGE